MEFLGIYRKSMEIMWTESCLGKKLQGPLLDRIKLALMVSVGKSRRLKNWALIRCSELLKSPHRFGKCDFYVLISIYQKKVNFKRRQPLLPFPNAFAITPSEEEKCERVETMLERTASQGLEPVVGWVSSVDSGAPESQDGSFSWRSLHIEDCVLYGLKVWCLIWFDMFISDSLFEHSVAGDMMASLVSWLLHGKVGG